MSHIDDAQTAYERQVAEIVAPEPAVFVADDSDDADDAPVPSAKDSAWLQTRTGRAWFARHPELYAYDIAEIATSLARESRFCGHTIGIGNMPAYSVAQHSVLVMRIVRDLHGVSDPRLLRAALLHDAAEAFWKDLPAPIKRMPELAGYRALIKQTEAAIFAHFGLADLGSHPLIKHADLQMLATEKRDIVGLGSARQWAQLPDPVEMRVRIWYAPDAEDAFLSTWIELGGEP